MHLIRYADDYIISSISKEMPEQEIMPMLKEFLQARGLTLSEEKTKITHIDEGFDFLGFNIRKYKGTLLILSLIHIWRIGVSTSLRRESGQTSAR